MDEKEKREKESITKIRVIDYRETKVKLAGNGVSLYVI